MAILSNFIKQVGKIGEISLIFTFFASFGFNNFLRVSSVRTFTLHL